MLANKLFKRQTANYLLKSVAVNFDLDCQQCLASLNKQQFRLFCASTLARRNNNDTLGAAGTAETLTRGYRPLTRQHRQQILSSALNHQHQLGVRQTSTTAATTAAATTNLKRDASTQAQQKRVDVHLLRQQQHHQHDPLDQLQPHRSPPHHHIYQETLDDELDLVKPFTCEDLEIVRCNPSELSEKPSADKLAFGHAFTDHMLRVDWTLDGGWSNPLISKLHNLDLHPGAKVLHYALEAFEGAKAYRGHDNKIRFFRLEQNVKRLLNSSRRLSLPSFDESELIKCIHKLVQLDQDWIPQLEEQQQLTSLYVRPTIMGVEPSLGVARSKRSILYVLLSPVGPYFKTGFKPISLYADPSFVRAWPGGAGNTKLGANYAPTIMVQKEAEKLGLQQVLWLFGEDMKLTEVGTMNVFVSMKHPETGKIHLVTPPLSDGLILPGITRASILELARQWPDVITEERYVTIGELQQLIHEDRLIEMFGAGTACVVCPISSIQLKDRTTLRIPFTDITNQNSGNSSSGTHEEGQFLTKRILQAITDIQYGRLEHPWATELMFN